MKVPVADADGWFKDTRTGSIECGNVSEYEKYMASRRAEEMEKAKMQALQNEVSELKSDMSDIKSLLLTLVQNTEKTS
jgi:cell shape-determining protein MreC